MRKINWFEGKDLAHSVSDSLIEWLGQVLFETGILTLEAERDQRRLKIKGYEGGLERQEGMKDTANL